MKSLADYWLVISKCTEVPIRSFLVYDFNFQVASCPKIVRLCIRERNNCNKILHDLAPQGK
jgi:hypothetical protein